MLPALGIVLHPRLTLGRLAERPRLAPGAAAVIATGTVSAGVAVAATLLAPAPEGGGGVIISLVLPALLLLFWAVSGWMIAGAATAMGAPRRRRDYLAVSGHTFPVLIAYPAILLVQVAVTRWGGGAGGPLSDAAGLLSLPVLMWSLALTVLAARAVFDVSVMGAIALALLPYAALCAAMLVLILVLSALRL